MSVQDRNAMELQATREILAEVFRFKIPDVDEIIENRSQARDRGSQWPLELWVGG